MHHYRSHPKDGEGNVFSLSTEGGCPRGTPPGQNGVPPTPWTGYAWPGYAAGGTPLAVSRRRTVLLQG